VHEVGSTFAKAAVRELGPTVGVADQNAPGWAATHHEVGDEVACSRLVQVRLDRPLAGVEPVPIEARFTGG
jgi:hypothetical protein